MTHIRFFKYSLVVGDRTFRFGSVFGRTSKFGEVRWFGRTTRFGQPNQNRTNLLHKCDKFTFLPRFSKKLSKIFEAKKLFLPKNWLFFANITDSSQDIIYIFYHMAPKSQFFFSKSFILDVKSSVTVRLWFGHFCYGSVSVRPNQKNLSSVAH